MKKITFTLSAVTALASMASLACLTGCESQRSTDWSNNCEANYSLSSREMSECLKKVEKGLNVEIEPRTVGIDPDNTERQSYDQIGKGGAGDSN